MAPFRAFCSWQPGAGTELAPRAAWRRACRRCEWLAGGHEVGIGLHKRRRRTTGAARLARQASASKLGGGPTTPATRAGTGHDESKTTSVESAPGRVALVLMGARDWTTTTYRVTG